MTTDYVMMAIRRALADHDTQAFCLDTSLRFISIRHFYHRWYVVAITDPGVVYNLRTWYRCDQSFKQEKSEAGHTQEKQNKKKT